MPRKKVKKAYKKPHPTGHPVLTVRLAPDVYAWLKQNHGARIRPYLEQLVRDNANLSATYRGEAPPFPPKEESPT